MGGVIDFFVLAHHCYCIITITSSQSHHHNHIITITSSQSNHHNHIITITHCIHSLMESIFYHYSVHVVNSFAFIVAVQRPFDNLLMPSCQGCVWYTYGGTAGKNDWFNINLHGIPVSVPRTHRGTRMNQGQYCKKFDANCMSCVTCLSIYNVL